MADKVTSSSKDGGHVKAWQIMSSKYYYELARMTTGMFVGVIALMTFLLTVGLQHPQKEFAPAFYTSVFVLALGLIMFVVGHMLQHSLMQQMDAGASAEKIKSTTKMLKIAHGVQQILFVLSVLAVLALTLVSAHIFFAIPAASSSAGAAAAPTQ